MRPSVRKEYHYYSPMFSHSFYVPSVFEYHRQMMRSWVVLTQVYLVIFIILLIYAVAAFVFRYWAMRKARAVGIVAKDRLLYLVLLLVVVENIILITIVSDYGGINGRLPWFLSNHASVMFHAAATSSPIITLAVWWASIASDRIKLGIFTSRNISVLGALAMTVLWLVAVIQMIVEPLSDSNFSNTWAAVVQMLTVIACGVFCIWVGVKFAMRLSESRKFSKSARVSAGDAALKRIETILVRTSIVLLIVLVTLLIFIPVAILATVNVLSPLFSTFIYTSMSIVQMAAVVTAVFTFPRSYGPASSSSSKNHTTTTSSGSRGASGSGVNSSGMAQ